MNTNMKSNVKINTQKNNLNVYNDSLQRMLSTIIQYRSILITLHRRIPYSITELDRIIDVELDRLLAVEKVIATEVTATTEKINMLKYKHVGTIANNSE